MDTATYATTDYNILEAADGNNRMFMVILCFSLLIHLLGLMHFTSKLHITQPGAIEMTLMDISKPAGRDIPTPRFRPKLPPMEQEIVTQSTTPKLLPTIPPMDLEPAKIDLPETLMEKIAAPDIPDPPSVASSDWQQAMGNLGGNGGFGSSRDYFDLIRMRIESNKKYPAQAKAMNREGKVTVRFTISPSGEARDITVVTSSGNRLLDRAALRAIRDSSPLPSLPQQFFSDSETVELTIVFELF